MPLTLPRIRQEKALALKPNEYHLVVFDPGGTIGWAHFVVDFKAFSRPEHKVLANLKSWDCGEFSGQETEQLNDAVALIRRAHFEPMPYVTRTDVVSEDFELTQLVGGYNLLSPVRINAVLDWECRKQGLALELQKRQVRTKVTPDRLTLFGFQPRKKRWTTTGKGKDEFAAMQHGVVKLRHIKEQSRKWPWQLSDGISSNARWDCRCERVGAKANKRKCDLIHPR